MLASLVNENVIDTGFLARDYQKQSKAIISNRHCDAHDFGEAVSTVSPAIKKLPLQRHTNDGSALGRLSKSRKKRAKNCTRGRGKHAANLASPEIRSSLGLIGGSRHPS